MKQLLLASLITLLAFGTACGQAPEPEPIANDGIQVHGHWTVTVTNPDGTVDAVHEFDNKLSQVGKSMLLGFLVSDTRLYKTDTNPSGWEIALSMATPGDGTELHCEEGYSSSNSTLLQADWTNFLPASVKKDAASKTLQLWAVCTVKKIVGDVHVINSVSTQPTVTMINSDGTAKVNQYWPIIPFTVRSLNNEPIAVATKTPAIMVNVQISFK